MRVLATFLAVLAACGTLAAAAGAAPVASAKSHGYRGDDAAKYQRLVGEYARLNCKTLAREYGKAAKLAGKHEKGTGLQVMGALIGRGKVAGAAAEIGGNVVKDAALRRDAAKSVYIAKGCR
ncbi:hypothetical protein [Vannielia litorea]|uniref:Uncharacterized protein n=1 Tax=Vannielia litorea TaxID=1217970 RepID=A0A1N6EXE5_9RHOB|nr:hypothetical protein [Vannielia litorea]SIN87627.1 hypothetical protein SAMN05444002_1179 [Vannielia litorea]